MHCYHIFLRQTGLFLMCCYYYIFLRGNWFIFDAFLLIFLRANWFIIDTLFFIIFFDGKLVNFLGVIIIIFFEGKLIFFSCVIHNYIFFRANWFISDCFVYSCVTMRSFSCWGCHYFSFLYFSKYYLFYFSICRGWIIL